MSIGERIFELRKKHNLTQAELAKRVFVSPKTVSKWENEYGLPDIKTMPALAKALGTDMEYLLTGERGFEDISKELAGGEPVSTLPKKPETAKVPCGIRADSYNQDSSVYKLQLHQVTHNHLTKWLVALGIIIIILTLISAPLSAKSITPRGFVVNGWVSILFSSVTFEAQGWSIAVSVCWLAASVYLFISQIIMVYAAVNGTSSYYVKTPAIQLVSLVVLGIFGVVGSNITNVIQGEIILKPNISYFILIMCALLQLILNVLISRHGKRVSGVKGMAVVGVALIITFTCIGMALPRNSVPTVLDVSATEMLAVDLQLSREKSAHEDYDVYYMEENVIAVKSNVKLKGLWDVYLHYEQNGEKRSNFLGNTYISTSYHRKGYYNFFSISCEFSVPVGSELTNFRLHYKYDRDNSDFRANVNSVEIMDRKELEHSLTQQNQHDAITSQHIFYEDTLLLGFKHSANADVTLKVGIAEYDGYYPSGVFLWSELGSGKNIEIKTLPAKANGEIVQLREAAFEIKFKNLKTLKRYEQLEIMTDSESVKYIYRYNEEFLIDEFMRRIAGK